MAAPETPSRSDGARAHGWITACAMALLAPGTLSAAHGTPVFEADVGIRAGRIAAIGSLAQKSAGRRIEARGLVVAPGFIDMLGQSEVTLLVDPHVPSKLYQGITTEITGEGDSVE